MGTSKKALFEAPSDETPRIILAAQPHECWRGAPDRLGTGRAESKGDMRQLGILGHGGVVRLEAGSVIGVEVDQTDPFH